jgi:hypothetical protein
MVPVEEIPPGALPVKLAGILQLNNMSTFGAPQYSPVRILSVIAAAELAVGGPGAESLADRLQRGFGALPQHAEAAASAGRSLLGALGLQALEVEPALAESVAAVLEAQSPGATAAWVRSLEERGGAAPGTSLGSLVSTLRKAEAAVPAPVPASAPTPTPAGNPAEPRPSDPVGPPDSTPTAEPAELTFEDDWTDEGESDPFAGEFVSDDLGLVDEGAGDASDGDADSVDDEIELEDEDNEESDDDDGLPLTDEAIDDLLADDSVDLDGDWMDDKPAS